MSHKTQTEDEFFIGWERKVPPIQRRFLYNRLIGIFAFAFTLALLVPALQTRYEPSFFQYMSELDFEGTFFASPVPYLMVDRPGTIENTQQPVSSYLLVNPKKYGFPPEICNELDGKTIRLRGSLIFNKSQTMIEVDQKSLKTITSDIQTPDPSLIKQQLGRYKLSGIIVDSKSYYGTLNPGFGKPHRACSVRSIANGVPPLLLIRSEDGEKLELLVSGLEGQPIGQSILEQVEIPVRVTGDIYRWGDKYIIETEPRLIETLEE